MAFFCVQKKENLIIVEETKPHLENTTTITTNKNDLTMTKIEVAAKTYWVLIILQALFYALHMY